MEVLRTAFVLVLFYFINYEPIHGKKIEEILTCANDTECDELTELDAYTESIVSEETYVAGDSRSTTTESIDNADSTTSSVNLKQVTNIPTNLTTPPSRTITLHSNGTISQALGKVKSNVCECDLTTSSCDINCCCDNDCEEFHLTSFSRCDNYHVELFDSRYCYNRNFIDRNNTPFILEKLAGNLFCILYDNLPPMYNANNNLVIKSAKDLSDAISPRKFNWKWEEQLPVPKYTFSSYREGDVVWKLYKNYVQPFELLQSGFTGSCNYKKTLRYLRGWKDQCLQTKLEESNEYLFPMAFSNFTVVTSPHLLNETYVKLSDQVCPRNVCLSFAIHYCHNNWKLCNDTEVLGSCSNGICHNIVTSVKYLIVHNGSMGINRIDIYFITGNVSRNFYQRFEVVYKWITPDKETRFTRSGNPGYIVGKPIIIGTLKTKKTMNTETRYISFNKTDPFLTLPVAQKNGECDNLNRYAIAFRENVKLKCAISLNTNNFTMSSCIELQNRTMRLLINNFLFNVTRTDQYNIYVSKLGNFTANNTIDWVQILLDRMPENVVTGQIINDRLHCSGLITSMHVNILYSALAKPGSWTNYNILGLGIKFSEESDISWSKCLIKNCTDTLKVDIVNYVTFHDTTKPSKYYFVGGPNLDIALPHDFFYPFLSNTGSVKPNVLLTSIIIFHVICTIASIDDTVRSFH